MKKVLKTFLAFAVLIISAVAVLSSSFSTTAATEKEHWIGAWGTAPVKFSLDGLSSISQIVGEVTVRTVITPSADGSKFRIKISNRYGDTPLEIYSITAAKSTGGSAIDMSSIKMVTFREGSPGVTVPVGEEIWSDPVTFNVNAHEDIAISMNIKEYQDVTTMGLSGADTYITTGEATRLEDYDLVDTVIEDEELLDFVSKLLAGLGIGNIDIKLAYDFINVVPCITNMDVLTDDSAYSVVVVGDSTVANDFPLYLSQALYEDNNVTNVGVVGKGLFGNSLLSGGLGLGSYINGESLLARFNDDVLSQDGLKYVILKVGANDIMNPVCIGGNPSLQPTAQELIDAYRSIFKKCHDKGIKVITIGITQWKGTIGDYFGTGAVYDRSETEFRRDWQIAKDVNAWLATTKEHDGYVNLNDISANPLDPDAFLPEYTNDGIHPTAGLQKIWANYFPQSLLGIGSMPGGVNISSLSANLYIGDKRVLTAEVYPATATNKDVEWYSENPEIATVNSGGIVTAVSNGTTNIVCKTVIGGFVSKCSVTVKTKPQSLALNYTEKTIFTTEKTQLVAVVLPYTASDKSVRWYTDNEKVATVSSTGIVTGVGSGTAVVTAETVDGAITASCKVTVKKKVEVKSLTIDCGSSKDIQKKTGYKNEPIDFTAVIAPSNATFKDVQWTSSKESIATVDESGRVTPLKAGKTVIKCASKDNPMITASCTLTVKVRATGITVSSSSIKVYEGKEKTLKVTIAPSDATNKSVTWKSENTKIATVDADGTIKGVNPGVVNIVATTANGKHSAKCKVTVLEVIKTKKVVLNESSITLKDGKSKTLAVTVLPSDATFKTLEWSSSNTKVAKVSSSGKVTAVNPGTATITCKTTDTGKTAKCKVTVTEVKPTSVSFSSSTVKVDFGKTLQLEATVSPSNATDKTLKWSSSDPSIVKVTSAGKVKGLKAGKSAVITVTTNTGKKKAQITVKVNAIAVEKISLNKTSATLSKSDTLQLKATISPSNATTKTVTWSTSDKKVATVSSSGLVKAVGNGTATITCKAKNGVTKTCKITVKNIPVTSLYVNQAAAIMDKGASFTLTVTIIPSNATNKQIIWTSSDTAVARVDSKGKVTAVGKGTCQIRATSSGGEWTDVCKITVR